MAFQPVPNTVSCEVRMTYLGQQIENVLHFTNESGVTESGLLALAGGVADWVTTEYVGLVCADLQFRELYFRDLSVSAGMELTSTFTGVFGTLVGNPNPGSVTLCLSLRTGLAGRSYRGRVYVSGSRNDDISGNQFTSAYVDDCVAAWVQLTNELYVPAGWDWRIVSRVQNGAPLSTGVATTITTVSVTNNDIDSQRRRLTGRGA